MMTHAERDESGERVEVQLALLSQKVDAQTTLLATIADRMQEVRVWQATVESRAEQQHKLVSDVGTLLIWKALLDPDLMLRKKLEPLLAREVVADGIAVRTGGVPKWIKVAGIVAAGCGAVAAVVGVLVQLLSL